MDPLLLRTNHEMETQYRGPLIAESEIAKTFQIADFKAQKLSRQYIQKLYRVSGNFPKCPETFKSA